VLKLAAELRANIIHAVLLGMTLTTVLGGFTMSPTRSSFPYR
jgi:hypothetical protein